MKQWNIVLILFLFTQAQPAKHSTMQYPITDDLVNQVGLKPERVFKVVFCGDSGVGKSSYIWRVCNEDDVYEQSNFSTTIGAYCLS